MRNSLTFTAAIVLAALPAVPAAAVTVEATITALENEWTAAQVKKDYATIERIVAKDWSGQNASPMLATRDMIIADLKSGTQVYKSMKNGPIKVTVMGDVAVAQGSDVEVSTYKGKNTSGKYTWTDIYAKRGGDVGRGFSQVSKADS